MNLRAAYIPPALFPEAIYSSIKWLLLGSHHNLIRFRPHLSCRTIPKTIENCRILSDSKETNILSQSNNVFRLETLGCVGCETIDFWQDYIYTTKIYCELQSTESRSLFVFLYIRNTQQEHITIYQSQRESESRVYVWPLRLMAHGVVLLTLEERKGDHMATHLSFDSLSGQPKDQPSAHKIKDVSKNIRWGFRNSCKCALLLTAAGLSGSPYFCATYKNGTNIAVFQMHSGDLFPRHCIACERIFISSIATQRKFTYVTQQDSQANHWLSGLETLAPLSNHPVWIYIEYAIRMQM